MSMPWVAALAPTHLRSWAPSTGCMVERIDASVPPTERRLAHVGSMSCPQPCCCHLTRAREQVAALHHRGCAKCGDYPSHPWPPWRRAIDPRRIVAREPVRHSRSEATSSVSLVHHFTSDGGRRAGRARLARVWAAEKARHRRSTGCMTMSDDITRMVSPKIDRLASFHLRVSYQMLVAPTGSSVRRRTRGGAR
jgi:hypothetical protein